MTNNQKLINTIESELDRGLIPKTDFTKQIQVNAYEARNFIGRIETQISILETLNKSDEAKHWRDINGQAHKLFGIPYNGTHPATQSKIESAYNQQENGNTTKSH